MNNYKIKVNDEAESKEAQELFVRLGYKLFNPGRYRNYKTKWIVSFDDGDLCLDKEDLTNHQELTLPQLRDLVAQSKSNEQGLISGADAKLAWANGEALQIRETGTTEWLTLTDTYTLMVFDYDRYEIRKKPRTIKIELEIPAPFEPKEGEKYWWINPNAKLGYSWDSNDLEQTDFNRIAMGVWPTEEEIKQVVAALRGIKG